MEGDGVWVIYCNLLGSKAVREPGSFHILSLSF